MFHHLISYPTKGTIVHNQADEYPVPTKRSQLQAITMDDVTLTTRVPLHALQPSNINQTRTTSKVGFHDLLSPAKRRRMSTNLERGSLDRLPAELRVLIYQQVMRAPNSLLIVPTFWKRRGMHKCFRRLSTLTDAA